MSAFTVYTKERTGDRVIDKFQDAFADFLRSINLGFLTSDRIARRTMQAFRSSQWAAVNTALVEQPFFVCPYDIEIKRVAWVGRTAIAVNNVDYREMSIARWRNGALVSGKIATRTTQKNGNAVAAFTPWDLVLSTDINVLRCKENDVITVAMPEFGNGPAVDEGGFVIDYDILRETGR